MSRHVETVAERRSCTALMRLVALSSAECMALSDLRSWWRAPIPRGEQTVYALVARSRAVDWLRAYRHDRGLPGACCGPSQSTVQGG